VSHAVAQRLNRAALRPGRIHPAGPQHPMMSSPWAAAVFVAAAALSLGASAVLVVRLERVGTRLGLSEALLGLVAAVAADTPEVTSAVTALAHGQHDVGTGVILGSNAFNLAALIGLGAVVAGGIKLHRRVVIFEGTVALWIAALAIAAVTGLITPVAALVLALAVVVAASAAMERTASALGARWAVPGVITGAIVLAAVTSMPNAVAAVFLARRGRAAAALSEAFNSNTLNVLAGLLIPAVIIASPGLGGALRVAVWYGVLTVATIALALAGRGINRRSGALIIAAYLVFAITVIAKAIPPGA
jgi:cation:H+ antiporter